jgi:capsid portal protein
MEEVISKVFDHPEATQLKFMYYKQRHVQPVVFFKAVQMQQSTNSLTE